MKSFNPLIQVYVFNTFSNGQLFDINVSFNPLIQVYVFNGVKNEKRD